MSKKDRLKAIEKLIVEFEIDTQEELTSKLIDMGYNVSQATVSRDISELNLIKIEGNFKKYKYSKAIDGINLKPQIVSLFKQVTTSVACANNLIVIKTLAGNASAAGMAFDEMHFPQVLGTVAGDDTLLVIAKTNADAEIILKSLRTL
jgi:transcriptional regulator of arginine metabolism